MRTKTSNHGGKRPLVRPTIQTARKSAPSSFRHIQQSFTDPESESDSEIHQYADGSIKRARIDTLNNASKKAVPEDNIAELKTQIAELHQFIIDRRLIDGM